MDVYICAHEYMQVVMHDGHDLCKCASSLAVISQIKLTPAVVQTPAMLTAEQSPLLTGFALVLRANIFPAAEAVSRCPQFCALNEQFQTGLMCYASGSQPS